MKYASLIKIILSLYLPFSTFVFAIENFDNPLTISELVNIGLENHPSTRKAWWNANRAASILGSAKSAYYPSLELGAYITHGRDFKYINGPDTNFTIFGADLYLSMILLDFGERNANVKSAKASLQAAKWESDWNINQIMVEILENAYASVQSQTILKAAYVSLQDAERMLHAANELYHAGLSPISDVYLARATLAQLKIDVAQKKSLYDIQKAKLSASLGISPDINLELMAIDQIQLPETTLTSDLIALAVRQRSDLLAKHARVTESMENIVRAKASYKPKVSLNARGGANRAIHENSNTLQYEVTLNLDVPIFNGFETMYQNRVALSEAKLSLEEEAQLQLDIAVEVLTNSRVLQAAQEMLPLADEDLKNSIDAYGIVLEKYKAGKVPITEISNAMRQLAEARVRFSDIKTRWLIAAAKLAFSTGTLAPYLQKSCAEEAKDNLISNDRVIN